MKTESRLCVEAVIRWEQMTGRSFITMDFTDEIDVLHLLYCATVVWAEPKFTYETFAELLEKDRIKAAVLRSFSVNNEYAAQFVSKTADKDDQNSAACVMIGTVASKLIIQGGMDAHFVLREMLVEDIPLYIEALNARIKSEEESRRLWTYYTIVPHIDGKKISAPDKMHVFPWEAEEADRVAREEMTRNEEMLHRFLSGEILNMDSIKWHKRSEHEQ